MHDPLGAGTRRWGEVFAKHSCRILYALCFMSHLYAVRRENLTAGFDFCLSLPHFVSCFVNASSWLVVAAVVHDPLGAGTDRRGEGFAGDKVAQRGVAETQIYRGAGL